MSRSDVSAWNIFEPSASRPWNRKRVVHLHRRTGFSASWPDLERDLNQGAQAAIDRVLARVNSSNSDVADAIGAAASGSSLPLRLKGWWLHRMMTSPEPLSERLALMWHNHFATSNRKVNQLTLMKQQNDLFLGHGRHDFGTVLSAVIKHPAMLRWLDAGTNRKGKPNENLARELLELFTLGVGHYTETDIKEVARALTGWQEKEDEFRFVPSSHDNDVKQILGSEGNFDGDDVLRLTLNHPATASRLAWRLCRTFLGETVPDSAVDQLAEGLRVHDLNINWAVETIIRSERFFDDTQMRSRVLGPPEYVVGAVRALELEPEMVDSLQLAEWTTKCGQDLFYPPNVGGWKEGRSWLSSSMIIARSNYAAAVVSGQVSQDGQRPDLESLFRKYEPKSDIKDMIGWFARLLWGESDLKVVADVAHAASEAKSDNPLLTGVALLLSSPAHFQS